MDILALLSVGAMSSIKILPAVGMAVLYQLNPVETFLSIAIGGIAGATIFTLVGARIRQWRRRRRKARRTDMSRPLNLRKARKITRIWNKWGLYGVALLTPPMISPPFGAIIAVAFGERFGRIMTFMTVSTVVWAGLFALLGKQIIAWLQ